MKKQISKIISHPLISGSAIIFIGSLIGNIFNFFFNLYMSRNLSVEEYGELASLISLILLTALAADSFVPTIVSFAGPYFLRKEQNNLEGLFFQVNKLAVIFGGVVILLFLLFSKYIGIFFNITDNFLIILVGFIVFFGLLNSISRAFLQAELSFVYISLITIFSSLLKLIGGALLVFLSFGVGGALWAFVFTFVSSYFLFIIPLRSLLFSKNRVSPVGITKLFSYAAPATLSLLGLTFFITTDVILIKHFFSAREAGLYAGLSLIGKVIFFFSTPVGMVMFPLIVHKHHKNEEFNNTFKLAVAFVFVVSTLLTIFYFIFPEFTIRVFLKNDDYFVLKPLLGLFGVFITIYSVTTVLTNFYLSIRKTRVFLPVIFCSLLQAALIWFFHNSFYQVIIFSILCISLLLIILLLYYFMLYGSKTKDK